jgi:hypothetical protein
MIAQFDKFEIEMTKKQAMTTIHPGDCEKEVCIILQDPKIKRQLEKISDSDLVYTLKQYGAWTDEDLIIREENEKRIIWIAAGDIFEEGVRDDKN